MAQKDINLNSLIGKDMLPIITSAKLCSGKTQDGREFMYIEPVFINGFTDRKFRLYMNGATEFAIKDALNREHE